MDHRTKERQTAWEVVDVDLAFAFQAYTPEQRDDLKAGIELVGHRVIVKEFQV